MQQGAGVDPHIQSHVVQVLTCSVYHSEKDWPVMSTHWKLVYWYLWIIFLLILKFTTQLFSQFLDYFITYLRKSFVPSFLLKTHSLKKFLGSREVVDVVVFTGVCYEVVLILNYYCLHSLQGSVNFFTSKPSCNLLLWFHPCIFLWVYLNISK